MVVVWYPETMDSTGPNVDASMWPILIIKEAESGDVETVQGCLGFLDELYATRKEPYVTIIDAQQGHRPSANQRYLQTEFRRKHEDHVKRYSLGTAIVFKSEILKAVITAMFWIKPPDTVTKAFTDMNSALDWARSRLQIAQSA